MELKKHPFHTTAFIIICLILRSQNQLILRSQNQLKYFTEKILLSQDVHTSEQRAGNFSEGAVSHNVLYYQQFCIIDIHALFSCDNVTLLPTFGFAVGRRVTLSQLALVLHASSEITLPPFFRRQSADPAQHAQLLEPGRKNGSFEV